MKKKHFSLYESLYEAEEQAELENNEDFIDDPSADASDYAMTAAEKESQELYGEIDIDKLAREEYDFVDEKNGLSAGEQYIEHLTKNLVGDT